MLQEIKSIDLIELLENGAIQVREANKVLRDGVEIAKEYHRYVLNPGDDLTNQPEKIIAIANVIWTKEVIDNYKSLYSQSFNIIPMV